MGFPSFSGLQDEEAADFCDEFELACLIAKKNEEGKLKVFPFSLKAGAKAWYNGISNKHIKEDWKLLKQSFLDQYNPKESIDDLLSPTVAATKRASKLFILRGRISSFANPLGAGSRR